MNRFLLFAGDFVLDQQALLKEFRQFENRASYMSRIQYMMKIKLFMEKIHLNNILLFSYYRKINSKILQLLDSLKNIFTVFVNIIINVDGMQKLEK